MHSVKLDDLGRVVAVASGPPRDGWVAAPEGQGDHYGLCHDGECWRELTHHERVQRDRDLEPEAPKEHPAKTRLRALKGKKSLTPQQLERAVLDIVDAL